MGISVGDYAFDAATTVVREAFEAVGGRQTRAIRITGVLRGLGTLAAVESALDAMLDIASESAPVYVSLRTGRRVLARREGFSKEVNARARTGQFVLDLRAENTLEESEALHTLPWSIAASGATIAATNAGNAPAPTVITLAALGAIVAPAIGDGSRTLLYEGVMDVGAVLVIDGAVGRVLLDDMDVTPYTTGEFPMLAPGENALTYTDDAASSHLIDGEVAFRDRWW